MKRLSVLHRQYAGGYGLVFLCIFLTAAPKAWAAEWQQPYPKLGSCTKFDTDIFSFEHDDGYTECMAEATEEADRNECEPLRGDPVPYAEWSTIYHGNVGSILESFIGRAVGGDFAQREPPGGIGMCSGSQSAATTPAPALLGEIAEQLEPWMGSSTAFGQSDTTPVLLEYLRVYECTLAERSTNLLVEVWRDESARRAALPGGLAANPFTFTHMLEKWYEQKQEIQRELAISRPTLERALMIMGTVQMTRVLTQDTQCLQRASLDIRNALALSADTASCLPRIWNAKDPLRDPSVCSDGRDNDNDSLIDLRDDGCDSLSDMQE